jgi:hypothetical protein
VSRAALPPTSPDALRDEITRLRAELENYQGHEPTVREEMAYVQSENDRLDADAEQARRIAVALEQENARLRQVVGFLLTNTIGKFAMHVYTSDIDAMAGRVTLADDPATGKTTITYQWLQDVLAAPGVAS